MATNEKLMSLLHRAYYRNSGIAQAAIRVQEGLEKLTPEKRAEWKINPERLMNVIRFHSIAAQVFALAEMVADDTGQVVFEEAVCGSLKLMRDDLRQLATRIESGAAPPSDTTEDGDETSALGTVLVFKMPGNPGEVN